MPNPLAELRRLLEELESYLRKTLEDPELSRLIRAAVDVFDPLDDLIDSIIDLLTQVRQEIEAIDLTVEGLTEASDFARRLIELISATQPFLPADAARTVDAIVGRAQFLGSLTEELDETRAAIVGLINTVIGQLQMFRPQS
jgi:ABC-type transporter Mla subunit MlaD